MKRLIFIPMLFMVLTAFGQHENMAKYEQPFLNHLMLRAEVGVGSTNKGFEPYFATVKLGYEFMPRLSAFGFTEGQLGVYDKDEVEDVSHSYIVGGGLSYLLFKPSDKNKDNCSIKVHAMMGASVGNSDLNQTVYEVGTTIIFGAWPMSPAIGLAFRHANMHTSGANNYNGLMATIGFGF